MWPRTTGGRSAARCRPALRRLRRSMRSGLHPPLVPTDARPKKQKRSSSQPSPGRPTGLRLRAGAALHRSAQRTSQPFQVGRHFLACSCCFMHPLKPSGHDLATTRQQNGARFESDGERPHCAGASKSAKKRAKAKEKQQATGLQDGNRSVSAAHLRGDAHPSLSQSTSAPDLQVCP